MEQCLNELTAAVKTMRAAWNTFQGTHKTARKLDAYLGSKAWRNDRADDEAGKLPQDLKRGVLSEDGIWNALEEYRQLAEEIQGTLQP